MINKKSFFLLASALLIFTLGIAFSYIFTRPNPASNIFGASTASTAGQQQALPSDVPSDQPNTVLVTRVIDGDTIEIEGGVRVRYIGIDTPESVHPDLKTQCFATEASNKNRELVEGKRVRLEKDISETDKYGRLLRYVYTNEARVNDLLVLEGYAQSSSYPPDIKYQNRLNEAQQEAQLANRGLWGGCGAGATDSNIEKSVEGCNIKGNISSSGEKIYHTPGQKYWSRTAIDEAKGERYFCTENEAQEAGFRRSKV